MRPSASRCVAIVRRAGKSPPGGASRAAPAPREQRTEQQHRSAQPPDQRRDPASLVTVAQRTRSVVVPMPSTVAPRPSSSSRHHLDVADARHVGQHAFLVRQQAGGQQRQRRVLVALDRDAARQAPSAFNPER